MSSDINHQDWQPVVFKKKVDKTVTNKNLRNGSFDTRKKQNPNLQKFAKIDAETETFKVKKVSKKVGQEIQKGRLAKKLNQKQLAQAINVTPKVINEFESGKAQPNEAVKRKIANYLKIKI